MTKAHIYFWCSSFPGQMTTSHVCSALLLVFLASCLIFPPFLSHAVIFWSFHGDVVKAVWLLVLELPVICCLWCLWSRNWRLSPCWTRCTLCRIRTVDGSLGPHLSAVHAHSSTHKIWFINFLWLNVCVHSWPGVLTDPWCYTGRNRFLN